MPASGPPNRFMSGCVASPLPSFICSARKSNDPNLTPLALPHLSRNVTSSNCDANVNFNQGCGVQFSTPASYGSAFNAAGGGFFVLVRSRAFSPGVSIWFWARDDPRVPLEVRTPPPNPAFGSGYGAGYGFGVAPASMYPTAWWGEPDAVFPLAADSCDYASHFDAHNFVFDLTFCVSRRAVAIPLTTVHADRDMLHARRMRLQGDWAGTVYPTSGCGTGSCDDCESCFQMHLFAYSCVYC